MHTAIAELEQAQIRSDIPEFRPGDTLKVHVRVVEGTRSRIQVFQGVVLRRQGAGDNAQLDRTTGIGNGKRDQQEDGHAKQAAGYFHGKCTLPEVGEAGL